MVLVDTNVLLDIVEDDPARADWSQHQLDAWSLRGRLCIGVAPVRPDTLRIAGAMIEQKRSGQTSVPAVTESPPSPLWMPTS